MKNLSRALAVLAMLASVSAFAAAKTYQVTGPVLSVDDKTIVVQKGDDKWEIDRNAATKVNGDLKVGSKVTIQYTMTAADVEVKGGEAPAKKAEAKETKEKKK